MGEAETPKSWFTLLLEWILKYPQIAEILFNAL